MARRFRRQLGVRLVAIGLMAVFVCLSVGVMPTPALLTRWMAAAWWVESRATTRHPCEDHLCGCTNAHECWAACCCFTSAQRLAWAIENGVEPPHAGRYSDDELTRAGDEVAGRRGVVPAAILRLRLARGIPTERAHASSTSTRLPSVSALGCKMLQSFFALAAPVSVIEAGAGSFLGSGERIGFVVDFPRLCESRALDISAPPPRWVV